MNLVHSHEEEKSKINNILQEERERSFQLGLKKGEALGYEKARNELSLAFHTVHKMGEMLHEQKTQLLNQMKPEVIEFALSVCEQVLRKELSQTETFIKYLQSLLTTMHISSVDGIFHVFLAPEDLIMLDPFFSEIESILNPIKDIRFLPDSTLTRGDCRIESKTGLLNSSIAREIENLRLHITGSI